MKPLQHCRLYTFVDTAYLGNRAPADVARQLCAGGSDIIQLRAKNASPEEIRRLAEAVLPVTRAAGVPLILNDHLDLALELGTEGCHLGQEDFFDAGHTDVPPLIPAGARLIVGLSTHEPAQALRSIAAHPSYIAIGPVYPTATKPGAKAVTLDYVRWAAAHVTLPWFAIGGINLDNVHAVLEAGARRICVVSAILSAANVTEACQAFRRQIASFPL